MRIDSKPTVLILGAGPAGLSVAYELMRRGVAVQVLEKGTNAGASFAAFPRNIYFGPWLNNLLPGSSIDWTWLLRRSTQPAYTRYLQEYARRNQVPVQTGVEVVAVSRREGYFVVEARDGRRFEAPLLINATGYFSKPYTPEFPGASSTSIRQMHVAGYRDPSTVREVLGRDTGRILVVGKRLSAGETMVELCKAGFSVTLSHRGQLKFGPSTTVEALFSPSVWVLERLAVALRLKLDSYPPMAGGESKRLVKSGRIETRPNLKAFEGDLVLFEDGRSESYDLVIYATGYRAVLDHLQGLGLTGEPELSGMEARRVPGLFFLGLDGLRSYRSRFLRGIVEDSRALADLVARRATRVNVPVSSLEPSVSAPS